MLQIGAWIAGTYLFVLAMCICLGVPVALEQLSDITIVGLFILLCGYALRGMRLGMFLLAFAAMHFFNIGLTLGMNVVATTARPLADSLLTEMDCGVSVLCYKLVKHSIWADATLVAIYRSIVAQTFIAVFYLTAMNKREEMCVFIRRYILGGLATLIGFYWLPAIGTSTQGLMVPEYFASVQPEFERVRAGVDCIGLLGSEGIITFPSFHTIWAVILIWVYRDSLLFLPMLFLNGLMLVSTMTAGMHYFPDVVVGVMICWAIFASTPLPVASSP